MSKTKLNHKERRIGRKAVRNFINRWSNNENQIKSIQTKKKHNMLTINTGTIQTILIVIKLFDLIKWNWILVLLPIEIIIFMAIFVLIFKPFGWQVNLSFPWDKEDK